MASSKSRSSSSRSGGSGSSGGSRGGSSRSGGNSRSGGGSRGGGGAAQVTRDHDEIRQWVESRGGHPACVAGTERGRGAKGAREANCLLRIDYPGFSGEGKLKEMDWQDFFDQFDKQGLAFLYQDKTKGGRTSRFSKFVTPETAENAGGRGGRGERGGRAGGKSRARGRDAR